MFHIQLHDIQIAPQTKNLKNHWSKILAMTYNNPQAQLTGAQPWAKSVSISYLTAYFQNNHININQYLLYSCIFLSFPFPQIPCAFIS